MGQRFPCPRSSRPPPWWWRSSAICSCPRCRDRRGRRLQSAPSAVPEKAGPGARAAAEVVALVRRGEYLAALGCPQARALLLGPSAEAGAAPASADASDAAAAADFYASIASNVAAASAAASARGGVEPAAHELLVLAVGVAALNAFHQVNVTAPTSRTRRRVRRRSPSAPAAAGSGTDSAARLAVDGEDLVGKYRLPQYLLASALLVERSARRTNALVARRTSRPRRWRTPAPPPRAAARAPAGAGAGRVRLWAEPLAAVSTESVETTCAETTATPPSCAWWSARAVLAHQRLLSGRSPTLRRRALAAAALASFAPENKPARAFGDARAAPEASEASDERKIASPLARRPRSAFWRPCACWRRRSWSTSTGTSPAPTRCWRARAARSASSSSSSGRWASGPCTRRTPRRRWCSRRRARACRSFRGVTAVTRVTATTRVSAPRARTRRTSRRRLMDNRRRARRRRRPPPWRASPSSSRACPRTAHRSSRRRDSWRTGKKRVTGHETLLLERLPLPCPRRRRR